MALEGFAPIDFHAFHRDTLPERLAGSAGAAVSAGLGGLEALAFQLPSGDAYTYVPRDGTLVVKAGSEPAATVIEVQAADWEGLVHDYESAAGLLYGNRARCLRGNAMRFIAWEPVLRALFVGRPIYDPNDPLLDDAGRTVDPRRVFAPDDPEEDMAAFLAAAGFLVVRGLYSAVEVAGFLAEAEALRSEAVKGDKLSWWATTPEGEEICCRVTRAVEKPKLATLYGDPRLRRLADLAGADLAPREGEGTGVTCIYKSPGIEEGLSDLPWHRDCGMGGHALMCPVMVASVFLTPATPETGELCFLPGSARASCAFREATDARGPAGIGVAAEPGDVSLHFGDVMHAAPPPTRPDLARYRISATTNFGPTDVRPHTGAHSYNDVLHGREDGQIEHLAKVADRASAG
ncbi:MAG: phytanoyl-CoA dioxygenase family protein [Myxococcota bacterium]|nr:phytanoyl-CoA dioxygenase family protein [Myxococcota bacterium]